MSGRWRVERLDATAAEIHGRPLVAERTVSLCRARDRALVLGSTQPDGDVAARAVEAAGVAVVRRRSGGGAVLVDGDVVWVDVVVPAGDPLWHDDVGRAMWWVGETWAAALGALGGGGDRAGDDRAGGDSAGGDSARGDSAGGDGAGGDSAGGDSAGGFVVHRGALRRTAWSRQVCFAGVGAGEVLTADGRKVVGISQRRTRELALFQCAVLLRWRPRALVDLLALDPAATAGALAAIEPAAAGVVDLGLAVGPDEVEQSFIRLLP